jgi:hypothetical protein
MLEIVGVADAALNSITHRRIKNASFCFGFKMISSCRHPAKDASYQLKWTMKLARSTSKDQEAA